MGLYFFPLHDAPSNSSQYVKIQCFKTRLIIKLEETLV